MDYYYIPNTPLTEGEEVQEQEGIVRRRREDPTAAGALGAVGAGIPATAVKNLVWQDLSKTLGKEFDEIRNDPELNKREMQNLIKTYNNFKDQTGLEVEHFVNMPGKNIWAAGQTPEGEDVVWWDSTAPHAAVMAHELGHVHMNHANPITDPLAGLQTSGIGRLSGAAAPVLGALGGYAGQSRYGTKGGFAGTALGALLGSGNFAYELGGATGRAMGYLPEEVDQQDAYGDLFRAGMTYAMGGPGTAVAMGLGGMGAVAASRNPAVRRFAGDLMDRLNLG